MGGWGGGEGLNRGILISQFLPPSLGVSCHIDVFLSPIIWQCCKIFPIFKCGSFLPGFSTPVPCHLNGCLLATRGSRHGSLVRVLTFRPFGPDSIPGLSVMWVKFVAGSCSCFKGFSLGSPVSLPPQKINPSKFQLSQECTWPHKLPALNTIVTVFKQNKSNLFFILLF